MGLFGRRSWDRLQKHKEASVAKALVCGYIQPLLRKWAIGARELRDFYDRMADAGTEPEKREAAMTNPILLERYCQTLRHAKGNLGGEQAEALVRWATRNPTATVPQ